MWSAGCTSWYNPRMATHERKPHNNSADVSQKLSLAPLSFEEALEGLLKVAPPPKDEQPEREPPREKPTRKRKQPDKQERPPK